MFELKLSHIHILQFPQKAFEFPRETQISSISPDGLWGPKMVAILGEVLFFWRSSTRGVVRFPDPLPEEDFWSQTGNLSKNQRDPQTPPHGLVGLDNGVCDPGASNHKKRWLEGSADDATSQRLRQGWFFLKRWADLRRWCIRKQLCFTVWFRRGANPNFQITSFWLCRFWRLF